MRARLLTLCGCSQELEIPELQQQMMVPIHRPFTPFSLEGAESNNFWIKTRVFKLDAFDGTTAIYREQWS